MVSIKNKDLNTFILYKIMRIFVELTIKERELIFSKLKVIEGGSWEKAIERLHIGRTMFFNYLSGRSALPLDILEKIKQKTNISLKEEKLVYKEKYLKKEAKSLKLNSELCEIFGILNGDGHISMTTHEISVVGNKFENDYASHVKSILQNNLGLNFRLSFNSNSFKVRAYSKDVANMLNKKYSLPIGNKIGQLKIPKVVYIKRKWLLAYIRGLFDTDGCFHIRRQKDVLVNITSADPEYLREIQKALKLLGFDASLGDKKVTLYGARPVNNFFKKVKPANSKHLKKYQEYVNSSAVSIMVV